LGIVAGGCVLLWFYRKRRQRLADAGLGERLLNPDRLPLNYNTPSIEKDKDASTVLVPKTIDPH
jgi:hypothetical protein